MAADDSNRDAIDQDLVTALAHPLRVRILEVLNEWEASPKELAKILEVPLGNAAYHCNVLRSCQCVELTRTQQRRGALEHYFRAVPRSYIGHQAWRKVPKSLRGNVTAASLETFMKRAVEALEAGTIDARDDTTLTWMTLALDEAGWAQATEILAAALSQLQAVHDQSRERLETSSEKAKSVIVGLAGFESAGRKEDGKGA